MDLIMSDHVDTCMKPQCVTRCLAIANWVCATSPRTPAFKKKNMLERFAGFACVCNRLQEKSESVAKLRKGHEQRVFCSVARAFLTKQSRT